MKRCRRISTVLHALLHMARLQEPVTSDTLARAMRLHPVEMRRLMAGLRYAGFATSARRSGSAGSGWVLRASLSEMTLGDIHDALGAPPLPLRPLDGQGDLPACRIERAVHEALGGAYRQAEPVLFGRMHRVSLEALSEAVRRAC